MFSTARMSWYGLDLMAAPEKFVVPVLAESKAEPRSSTDPPEFLTLKSWKRCTPVELFTAETQNVFVPILQRLRPLSDVVTIPVSTEVPASTVAVEPERVNRYAFTVPDEAWLTTAMIFVLEMLSLSAVRAFPAPTVVDETSDFALMDEKTPAEYAQVI